MNRAIGKALTKLGWMRDQYIWPNGLRHLWTDAFADVLLVSLYQQLRRGESPG